MSLVGSLRYEKRLHDLITRLIKHILWLAIPILFTPVHAQTPEPPPREPPTVRELIHEASLFYGVDEHRLTKTLECESVNLTYNGQSYHKVPTGPNGREDSWGYAQIHLPSNPNVTKEQALDPAFAVDFAASAFARGDMHRWSCYRLLYGET